MTPVTEEKKLSKWLNDLIELFAKISNRADSYVLKFTEKSSEGKNLKLQKMPLPYFDGDARFYPRFKREFLELVRPQVSKKEEAFMLRKCLRENVEAILGAGDFTFDEMIKRLDEKYGDPSKITDSIMSGISKFRKIENDDNKRILEFIGIIERAYHDLKGVKMEREINNTNVVSLIESKLPKNLAINWYRIIHAVDSKVDKSNKFPHLMQFLITERNALEYGMVDLRATSEKININYIEMDSEPKCLIHKSSSHKTVDCRYYNDLTVPGRYELLKENSACFACLSPEHMMNICKNKVKCINNGCGKFHHQSLHVKMNDSVYFTDPPGIPGFSCIFPIMKVGIGSRSEYANVLWDTCASVCLITESKARKLELRGSPSKLSIITVGGVENCIDSTKYKLPLRDLNGKTFFIDVYSINKISDQIKDIDMSKVMKYFPGLNKESIKRPKGEIDILIGYNYAAWHPVPKLSAGHLIILSNSFGMCVGGSHPEIIEKMNKLDNASAVNLISSKNIVSDFFSIESLGIECQPRCGNCKCGTCALGGKNCSLKEERELKLIENKLTFFVEGYWEAAYP
jgi:hypothetical protein